MSIFRPERAPVRGTLGQSVAMEIAGFTFTVGDLDGFRFVESVFPEHVDPTRIWAAAASYPTMWDEGRPTVTLNDVTRLGPVDAEAERVLCWVLQQNSLRAGLVASAWVTGDNATARERISRVLVEAGRSAETVFATRDEALAHVRLEILRWTSDGR